VRSAECLDTHYFAVLIGVGATTSTPIWRRRPHRGPPCRGLFGAISLDNAVKRFKKAVDEGLLKIMSKMGISVISSYRGGYNFEAVGLSRSLVGEFFPGMPEPHLGHRPASGIAAQAHAEQHDAAFDGGRRALPIGGFYAARGGETHAYSTAADPHAADGRRHRQLSTYRQLCARRCEGCRRWPARPAGLPRPGPAPMPIDEVESDHRDPQALRDAGHVAGRAVPEAHETLNIAMNRIGAKRLGRGRRGPASASSPLPERRQRQLAIKQIASGRFRRHRGISEQCREIEIKVAQGAKPGEGGQLPGFKVTELIARCAIRRRASADLPPPHHDIYSIEDLAQLIYDLKQINPRRASA
jgi:glutamate synthase (NADPH/NADH) large chain